MIMIQMFRYISVLMLLFVSTMVSAQSTIKVMTVSHGTVTVDKSSASKDATVTITVTPSSGYYFQKKNLEVVKTVNPNLAWASGEIPIADAIVVSGSDPSDLSKSRKYTFTVPDDGYELQVSAIFTACKKITADMVTLSATNFTYNGIDQKPTVSVKGLTKGVSYTVSFAESSWKEVGTYSVSVTGKSKYKGIVTKTFTISSDEEFKVKLNKSKLALQKGKTETLKATVSPSTLIDKSVTWKSSNTAVATVTSAGKIKGVKAGTATITCTSVVTGAKATCKVTVGYVKLDQAEAVIKKGKSLTLKATVYPTTLTDKSVKWESSNTKYATVSSDGKVTGVKYGTATITCTSNATGLSTTCKVTIGAVTLDQKEVAIKKGKTVALTPTVYPSSLEDKSVTWKSSDETVATVSTSGKVKGLKYGTATITSTSNATGLNATCKVTVGYVKLDQTEAVIMKGKSLTLKATVYPTTLADKSVKWESSNAKIATVSSSGKVTGVKVGTATITCTSVATGLSTTCKVTIGAVTLDQKEVAIKKGKTVTLTPTVSPSSLEDKSVTWKSSDETVATVSTAGKVKGIKYGTATITCTSNAIGLSTTCKVTVGNVTLSKSAVAIKKGKSLTLTAKVYPSTLTDKSVKWESSNTKYATVSSDGKVTGVKVGTATITCTSVATGLSTTCKVTIGAVTLDQKEVAIKKGKTVTLTPTVSPSSLEDKSVTWKSSDETVATVSTEGKVKGIKYGTAIITCTSNATGLSATCKVTVGNVKLDQTEATVVKGKTVTLKATVYPSTLTDNTVTWESSNTAVATVSTAGKVKGIKAGTATITCTSVATGLSTTCKITVTASSGTRSIEGDDDDDTTGIDELDVDPAEVQPFDVYDLSGRKVAHQVTSLEGLPNGIYIVNGKKMLKK